MKGNRVFDRRDSISRPYAVRIRTHGQPYAGIRHHSATKIFSSNSQSIPARCPMGLILLVTQTTRCFPIQENRGSVMCFGAGHLEQVTADSVVPRSVHTSACEQVNIPVTRHLLLAHFVFHCGRRATTTRRKAFEACMGPIVDRASDPADDPLPGSMTAGQRPPGR